MGERNDLIERRWIGVVPSGLQGPAKVTRLERVAEIWRNQGLFVTEWVPATTIANLSEALAEAEKKGAEGWQPIETAPKGKNGIAFMMLSFGPPGDQTVSEGLHFNGRFYAASVFHRVNPNDGMNYAFREHEVHPTHWRPTLAPPRDLSQGGQHG